MSTDRQTMRERLRAWPGIEGPGAQKIFSGDDVIRFAESEVTRAMQPREPSPELAEAERQLRMRAEIQDEVPPPGVAWARSIADELDRLRSELARRRSTSGQPKEGTGK